jgi:nitrite reductase/ring-hydroxylating ferredoxin subunit
MSGLPEMDQFVEVARLDEEPLGRASSFTIGGRQVAVFNVEGIIYPMDDSCLHKGASLSNGTLEGKIVTCRAHGWLYDVTSGSTVQVPGFGVTAHATKIVDGKILVELT